MDDIYMSGNGKKPENNGQNNNNQNQQDSRIMPQQIPDFFKMPPQGNQNQNGQANYSNPYIQNQQYAQNQYAQSPMQNAQNPYQQNPYQQNVQNNVQAPYGQGQQYSRNSYGQNPYQQSPYQQNSYQQNPYQQNPQYTNPNAAYNSQVNQNNQYQRPAYSNQPPKSANQDNSPAPAPKPQKGSNSASSKPAKKKKGKGLKILLAVLLVIAILFSSAFAVVYKMASKIDYNKDSHVPNAYVDADSLISDKRVTNILLIGVDGKTNDNSLRSDTMLMVSIDRNNKKIKLTSFLRDTWVLIPATGKHAKLNASFAYGGPQLVIDTIESNYNVKIDHYMLVGFDMFKTIIDSFGGVDVEVTEEEAAFMRRTAKPTRHIQAGPNTHMNGSQALVYCRIRKLDSDFMRTFRQRKVISALIAKAKESDFSTLMDVANKILEMIKTDISPFELTKLAFGMPKYISYEIASERIPSEGTFRYDTKNGQSVIAADINQNRQFLHNYLYSKDSTDDESASNK